MECMDKLLEGLAECGEAAAFYRGTEIVKANSLFADLFERDVKDFAGLPVVDICHIESIELIQDFIRRRAHGDPDLPPSRRPPPLSTRPHRSRACR